VRNKEIWTSAKKLKNQCVGYLFEINWKTNELNNVTSIIIQESNFVNFFLIIIFIWLCIFSRSHPDVRKKAEYYSTQRLIEPYSKLSLLTRKLELEADVEK